MSIDLTVDNYSVDDLILLFGGGINLNSSSKDIQESADVLIQKFTESGKPEIADFFKDASRMVIDHINAHNNDDADEKMSSENTLNTLWKQTPFVGDSRIIQPEPTFVISKERQLSITTQLVIIDSHFRTNILPYSDNTKSNSFNTNFSFALSKSISRAVSMKLISISIPTSWYTFTELRGNTFFTYNGHVIVIPDGNYTTETIVTTINSLTFTQYGLRISVDPINNRIKFENTLSYLISPLITFFIKKNMTNIDECGVRSSASDSRYRTFGVNSTLGWMLGFQITPNVQTGDVSAYIEYNVPLIAQSVPDVYGSKFFILSLEEFSNQRLTKGLSTIVSSTQRLFTNVSEFYATLKAGCQLQRTPLTHAQQLVHEAVSGVGDVITTNESSLSTYKIAGYQADAAFAVIPLDASVILANRPRNIPYQLSGVNLEIFNRHYKTPTIIEKIQVSLTDDKGSLVHLHGSDWAFVIMIEEQN